MRLAHAQRLVILVDLQCSTLLRAPPVDVYLVLELLVALVDKGLCELAQKVLNIHIVTIVGAYARHIVDTERLRLVLLGAVVPRNRVALCVENLHAGSYTAVGNREVTVVARSPSVARTRCEAVLDDVWQLIRMEDATIHIARGHKVYAVELCEAVCE